MERKRDISVSESEEIENDETPRTKQRSSSLPSLLAAEKDAKLYILRAEMDNCSKWEELVAENDIMCPQL